MSDIKFIQKYESDGQGGSSLISKEELVSSVEEIVNTNTISVEEQEMLDASTAHRLSLEEAIKNQG